MKKKTICIVVLILGLFAFWQPLQARAGRVNAIVIDRGEKAYTSFMSLTDEMTREARPNVDARETAKMVSWWK